MREPFAGFVFDFVGDDVGFQDRVVVERTDTAAGNVDDRDFVKLGFGLVLKHFLRIGDKGNQCHVVEFGVAEAQHQPFFHRIESHTFYIDFLKRNLGVGAFADQVVQLGIGFQYLRQVVVTRQAQHLAVLDFETQHVFAVGRTLSFFVARVRGQRVDEAFVVAGECLQVVQTAFEACDDAGVE